MNENNTNYAETIQVSSVIGNFSKAQMFLLISDAGPVSGFDSHTRTSRHGRYRSELATGT